MSHDEIGNEPFANSCSGVDCRYYSLTKAVSIAMSSELVDEQSDKNENTFWF
jgi:hypothetical protein